MTKPIPNTLKPSREGDYILITIPHHWARGETVADAKRNLTRVSGQPAKEWAAWRVHSVSTDTTVDIMGYINSPGDHEPIMLAEHNPS
jgi:hypothetical protein